MKFELYHWVNYNWDGNFAYASPSWNMAVTLEGYGHYIEIGMLTRPTERHVRKFKKLAKSSLKRNN